MSRLAVIWAILLVLVGCGWGEQVTFQLDNPLDQTIEVSLDGQVYELPPQSSVDVVLGTGTHEVVYQGQHAQFNVLFRGCEGGIINPTLSPYYVHYEVYLANDPRYDSNDLRQFYLSKYLRVDQVRGVEVKGYYRQENGLVIENFGEVSGWLLGLDDSYQRAYTTRSAVQVVGKIFRENDYVAYLKNELGLDFPAHFSYPDGRRLDALQRVLEPITLVHECQAVNAYLRDLNGWLDVLQSSSTDAKRLNEAYGHFKLMSLEFGRAKGLCAELRFLDAQGRVDHQRTAEYRKSESDFYKYIGGNVSRQHVFIVAPVALGSMSR